MIHPLAHADFRPDRDYYAAPLVTRKRALITVAVIVVGWLVLVSLVYLTHPRSEADFLAQAGIQGGDEIQAIVDEHGSRVLIDEGDRACDWLGAQQKAWVRHDWRFEQGGLVERYLAEMRPVRPLIWGRPAEWAATRGVVAATAWEQLCGGTWWMHRPHGPEPSGGGGQEFD